MVELVRPPSRFEPITIGAREKDPICDGFARRRWQKIGLVGRKPDNAIWAYGTSMTFPTETAPRHWAASGPFAADGVGDLAGICLLELEQCWRTNRLAQSPVQKGQLRPATVRGKRHRDEGGVEFRQPRKDSLNAWLLPLAFGLHLRKRLLDPLPWWSRSLIHRNASKWTYRHDVQESEIRNASRLPYRTDRQRND